MRNSILTPSNFTYHCGGKRKKRRKGRKNFLMLNIFSILHIKKRGPKWSIVKRIRRDEEKEGEKKGLYKIHSSSVKL